MKSRKSTRQRRGTILLIVVSLLALLFVIITGFLTVARNDRVTLRDLQRGDLTQNVIDKEVDKILTAIENAIRSDNGRFLSGPGAEFAEMPQNKGVFIQSQPMSSYTQNLNPPAGNYIDYQTDFANIPGSGWNVGEWEAFKRFCYSNVSKIDAAKGDKPTTAAVWQMFIENHRDTGIAEGRIDYRDIENASREPYMDADGNGLPDSWFAFQMASIEEANNMAGTPVQLTGTSLNPSQVPAFSNGSNPAGDALNRAFVLWRELARYEVAKMVISNGGMLSLDSPRVRDMVGNLVAPWNRFNTVRMFDDFRSPFDAINNPQRALKNYTPESRNYIFDQLAGEVSGVELVLHRRGGLAAAPLTGGRTPAHAVPAILAALQGEANTNWQGFPNTFVPQFRIPPRNQPAKRDNWERFNLQTAYVPNFGNERIAAVNSAQMSPHEFLLDEIQSTGSGGNATSLSSPSRAFERMPKLTTISYSDELSRISIPGDSIPSRQDQPAEFVGVPRLQITPTEPAGYTNAATAAAAGLTGPLHEGELKFPLQEVAKGIMQEPTGTYAGLYRWQRFLSQGTVREKRGDAIIERLARVYYDMLSQHDGWNNSPNDTEVLELREQAFQLAVNTAQFAMPRSPLNSVFPGFVDTVTYRDGVTGNKYIGNGPQPYLSEVVADVDFTASPGGGGTFSRIALGIELFNPCDPHFANHPAAGNPAKWQDTAAAHDVFAMPAEQYAISVGAASPGSIPPGPPDPGGPPPPGYFGTFLGSLANGPISSGIKRLNGRCFYTVIFHIDIPGASGDNTGLNNAENNLLNGPKTIAHQFREGELETFEVRLWKMGFREGNNGAIAGRTWYLVDKIKLDMSRFAISPQGFNDGHNWRSVARDSTPNRRFGAFDFFTTPGVDSQPDSYTAVDGQPDTFARWNMPTGIVTPDNNPIGFARSNTSPVVTLGNPRIYGSSTSSAVRNPDIGTGNGFSPTTPLVMMNAGPDGLNPNLPLYTRLNNLPMFGNVRTTTGNDPQIGDLRPRSFPTVGFMHFIPRYSHEIVVNSTTAGIVAMKTAGDYLKEQWEDHDAGNTSPDYKVNGAGLPNYPVDLGHMPIFDNSQDVKRGGVFDAGTAAQPVPGGLGKVPWGLLVYDYFTTLDPATPGVDPLRIAGRTNINQAQWNLMSLVPMIGPALPSANGGQRYVANAGDYGLPIRGNWPTAVQLLPVPTRLGNADANCDPSPSFWDPQVGMLVGTGPQSATFADTDPFNPSVVQNYPRLLMTDLYGSPLGNEWGGPEFDATTPTRWRLGKWLSISAAGYRDGVQNLGLDDISTNRRLFMRYADAYMRNPEDNSRLRGLPSAAVIVNSGSLTRGYRDCGGTGLAGTYGGIRGSARATAAASGNPNAVDRPTQFGFTTIGELLNVKGWDSSRPTLLPPFPVPPPAYDDNPVLAQGDFIKSVSLLALLDSQVLTTRTNTFTAYVSVMDRENPEASIRAQLTIDRSNLLPRLSYDYTRPPANAAANWRGSVDRVKTMNILGGNFTYATTDTIPETPVRWTAPAGLRPTIVAEKRIGYFNTRFDD